MACAGWKPVSLSDPKPYYPDYKLPPPEELEAMDAKSFNQWRTKAKRLWLTQWQKRWRYKDFTDEQEDELVKLYRDGRWAVFRDDDYPCGFSGKKYWDMSIDWEKSWEASKPEWYRESV